MTEIMNRYGRVGEIFYALLEIAPSEEIRDILTEFALGVFTDQTEEEATSVEAEVVRAIASCKDKATSDQRLSVETIVEEVNFGRGEKDRLSPKTVGWVTTRLGFKKKRMPDKKGSRAILLDDDLLQHLTETYDIEQPSKPADIPPASSEGQIVRKEGLFTFVQSPSDILEPTGKKASENVRTEVPSFNSGVSDILTFRGGDTPPDVAGQRTCIGLSSLEGIPQYVRKDPALWREFTLTVLRQEEARIGYATIEKIAFRWSERFSSQVTIFLPEILTSLEKNGSAFQPKPGCWRLVK